ncbi:hypothetical protein CEB3_c13930 [Peptococcaceae bacterium CEB3]|nr:hypothetical protein CEB3_c13930 [Peptococcaceae bacterium CEB3]
MDEAEICCPCGAEFSWEEAKAKGQPADTDEIRKFLLVRLGEKWDVSAAYIVACAHCGNRFVAAEIPEMCEPDENGDLAPAYLTLGWKLKDKKGRDSCAI